MRYSIAGGGSDLPRYLAKFGHGSTLTTTFIQSVYVASHLSVIGKHRLVYSEIEEVTTISEIRHRIMREVLAYFNVRDYLEIFSIADLPAKGTGLGASSSFCNSMVAAVARQFRINLDNIEVARITSEIEMNRAATESGFQDQYASAIGGISLMHFDSKGFIGSEKIFIGSEELEVIKWLNKHTIFLRVNGSRNSSDILRSIDFDDNKILEKQKEIVNLVPEMVKAIRKRDVVAYGNCLEHNWNLKKEINSNSSTQEVDSLHDLSVQYGAIGGKLLGAGSSGYLAMVVPNLTDPLRELIGNQLQLKISGQELITKEI